MSTETFLFVALLASWAALLFASLSAHRQRKADAQRENLIRDLLTDQQIKGHMLAQIKATLPEGQPRYLLRLADWGPDFTGEHGTLHRFRWVVEDADAEVREILADGDWDDEVGPVLMVGNAPSAMEAAFEALGWIERQRHPLATTVIVGDIQRHQP